MGSKLLLVDDSATIRNIIKIYLMGMQFEFIEADRAERALSVLKSPQSVNLIIADINMPGMDGLQFVRQLRSDADTRLNRLPVILLTGDKSDELRKQGTEAGANDFILKPVTSSNLRDAVQKFIPLLS
jgi:two-component system chemotaxis response regulator CheY